MCGLLLLLVLLAFPGWPWTEATARATESDEVIDQLEVWLDEPLDLATATEEELVLLPWLDSGLAGAIVGLRDHGGLTSLRDLEHIPGMDRSRIDALSPFVSLHGRVHESQLSFEGRSSWKQDASGRHRSRLHAQRDELSFLAQAESGQSAPSSAAASWNPNWGRVIVGDFRPQLPWPLLLENPFLRSRTAGPSLRRRSRLRPRLSSSGGSWHGGGIEVELENWHLLMARGTEEVSRDGPFLVLLEHHFADARGTTNVGLALRDGNQAGLCFSLHREGLRARLEWVHPFLSGSLASDRLCAAMEIRDGPARWGLAVTQAGGGIAAGQDPITGQSIDREHRVIQTSGRLSGGSWTFAALARHRRRGRTGEMRVDERWQLEASGPAAGSRLAFGLQVDEVRAEPSAFTFKLNWQERVDDGALRRGLRFRHQRKDEAVATLVALSLERGRRWLWRGVLALARGDRSSPWAVGVATAGLASTWLAPAESGLLCALARKGGRSRVGLWLRLVRDAREDLEFSGGLGFSWRMAARN
jgi:hypothetical protein